MGDQCDSLKQCHHGYEMYDFGDFGCGDEILVENTWYKIEVMAPRENGEIIYVTTIDGVKRPFEKEEVTQFRRRQRGLEQM